MLKLTRLPFLIALPALGLVLTGCTSVRDKVYYGTQEAFGTHKRDILVDRVDNARTAQVEAKAEFQSALQAFMGVVDVGSSELEDVYDRLNDELDDARSQASKVSSRIDDVENVANALFREWESELDQYSDQRLRQESKNQLERTRAQYQELIGTMHSAEARMDPVLRAFSDQVLYLKHNLNAMAISKLRNEAVNVRRDVEALVREMERAIDEANKFISQMRST